MNSDFAKNILAISKVVQEASNEIYKPPLEMLPSRSEGVLPIKLFHKTRAYIERVARQINKTYEVACYDACAVMIRRLIEILIIEVFEHQNNTPAIKNSNGDFFYLQDLIAITLQQTQWNLSRNIKTALPKIKDIGDKSAHARKFNAQRSDIDTVIADVRFAAEELLYLSGIKN